MRTLFVALAVMMLSACAAQQPQLQSTADALRPVPELEMSVPYPEVRAITLDGTCVSVLHGWRVVSNEDELVLERRDIGRITVINVGNSYEMLMDLWADHAEVRQNEYGDVMDAPDCTNPHGCQITYLDGESRIHVYQAGPRHIVELSYPADSRSGQFAIADAIRTARHIDCPQTEE